jgi:hypothetical protein
VVSLRVCWRDRNCYQFHEGVWQNYCNFDDRCQGWAQFRSWWRGWHRPNRAHLWLERCQI